MEFEEEQRGAVEIKSSMLYNEDSFHQLNDNTLYINESKPNSSKDSK